MKKWFLLNKKVLPLCLLLDISQCSVAQVWDTLPMQLNALQGGGVAVEALYIFKDTLFIGGAFYDADTLPLNGIGGLYNNKWIQFGTGLYNSGTAHDFSEYKNELYMSGKFQKNQQQDAVNGVPYTNGIARWDGIEWKSAGITSFVATLDVKNLETFNDTLYAGMYYGSTLTNGIGCCLAKWDGNNWYEVNENGKVYSMIVYDNELYVGGEVYMVDSVQITGLAKYNGMQWSDAGKGKIGSFITALGKDTLNGFLYAASTTKGISRWDGYGWKLISTWLNGGFSVPQGGDMIWYHGELYSGGGYSINNGDTIWGIARWNGYQWNTCGTGTKPTWGVQSFAVNNDTLYVGGEFTIIGGIPAHYLAKWHTPPDTTLCSYLQSSIIGSPDTVYLDSGGVAQFHANIPQASSWSWKFGDGQTIGGQNPVHIFDSAGIFNVQVVISYNGCLDTSNQEVVVMPYVDILETGEMENLQMHVYPNPSGGSFTVEIKNENNNLQNVVLKIIDVKGKLIKQFEIDNNKKMTIETNGWSKGIYLMNLISNGKLIAKEKVVIE